MLTFLLILLLVSNAVTIRRDKSILYSRIVIKSLLLTSYPVFFSLVLIKAHIPIWSQFTRSLGLENYVIIPLLLIHVLTITYISVATRFSLPTFKYLCISIILFISLSWFLPYIYPIFTCLILVPSMFHYTYIYLTLPRTVDIQAVQALTLPMTGEIKAVQGLTVPMSGESKAAEGLTLSMTGKNQPVKGINDFDYTKDKN